MDSETEVRSRAGAASLWRRGALLLAALVLIWSALASFGVVAEPLASLAPAAGQTIIGLLGGIAFTISGQAFLAMFTKWREFKRSDEAFSRDYEALKESSLQAAQRLDRIAERTDDAGRSAHP